MRVLLLWVMEWLVQLTMPERNPASNGSEVAIIEIEGRLLRAATE
jgi:hypothetical protein